MANGHLLKED